MAIPVMLELFLERHQTCLPTSSEYHEYGAIIQSDTLPLGSKILDQLKDSESHRIIFYDSSLEGIARYVRSISLNFPAHPDLSFSWKSISAREGEALVDSPGNCLAYKLKRPLTNVELGQFEQAMTKNPSA